MVRLSKLPVWRLALVVAGSMASLGVSAGTSCEAEFGASRFPPALAGTFARPTAEKLASACDDWLAALNREPGRRAVHNNKPLVRDRIHLVVSFHPGTVKAPEREATRIRLGSKEFDLVRFEPFVPYAIIALSPPSAASYVSALVQAKEVRYLAPVCDLNLGRNVADVERPELACSNNARAPTTFWGLESLNLPRLQTQTQSHKRIVAVFDTGIDCEHEALAASIVGDGVVIPGRRCSGTAGGNFVDPPVPPDNCSDDNKNPDCGPHGTHITGTLAGSGKLLSVAPEAKIMSLKVLYPDKQLTTLDLMEQATLFAVQEKASILNYSLAWQWPYHHIAVTIDKITTHGNVLIVAAATNEVGPDPYPAAYSRCSSAVIGVIGFRRGTEGFVWVSNSAIDEPYTAAPGGGIFSSCSDAKERNGYTFESGVSSAAPHVSGLAHRVWTHPKYAHCSAQKVRQLLECSRVGATIDGAQRKRLNGACPFAENPQGDCKTCIEDVLTNNCR